MALVAFVLFAVVIGLVLLRIVIQHFRDKDKRKK